ncbi:MAG: cytochrome c-type biogenesis protein CcmH [Desertimonas sp.]
MIAALKRGPGWVVLAAVVVALVALGTLGDGGAPAADERVVALTERVACPTCQGESVAASRAPAAEQIRTRIEELVDEDELSDTEILNELELAYGSRTLLVPKATGFDALVWAIPIAALVIAVAMLAATFLRWRREAAALQEPTERDRALVAAALVDEDGHEP